MIVSMKQTRTQDLREAFSSIISMILGLLRAQGWRGLLHLPTLWLVSRELRRMGAEFCALLDAFRAGTLPPAPAPWTYDEPQESQAAPAEPAATPRVRARVAAPRRPSQPAPAKPARAGSTRTRAVPRPANPQSDPRIARPSSRRPGPRDLVAKKIRLGRLALARPFRSDIETMPLARHSGTPHTGPIA